MLNLQMGGDFFSSEQVRFGPFVGLTLSMFFFDSSGDTVSKKALHEWILLGVRGRYDL